MAVRRYRVLTGLFVAVAVLVAVNGTALWGETTALLIDDALQLSAGLAAVVCGLVVALRVRGGQRAWRLLIVAGMAGWSAGQLLWSWYQLVDGRGLPSPSFADIGFLMFPIFALPALFVLAGVRAAPGRGRQRAHWTAHSVITILLDGLVVTGSFFILVWGSALRSLVGTTTPDPGAWAIAIAYPITDLLMAVVAVLLVMIDRVDRRYRVNFFLLAAGIVGLACSDRIYPYLVTIGAESMKPWADAGFVLGPLLIAYSVLEPRLDAVRMPDRGQPAMDWWQLAMPYMVFVGVCVLLGVQVIVGDVPDAVEVVVAILVVHLVVARQLVSLLDNRLLMQRVYAGQRRLTYQVHHDSLTGLPNRVLFAQRLDQAVSDRLPFVLMFVDLDDFKDVNDRFGHAGGDQLLHAVGQRLRGCLRTTDTLARIGGDEFAILLQGELEAPDAVADRVRTTLQQPFALHGSSVRVRASMGLVVPEPNEPELTSDELLWRADSSMYAGKRLGKDTAVLYHQSSCEPVDFPTALRRAKGGVPAGFSLSYQSIVRLPDATPVAVEALARWTAPNGTQIAPETFVPAAEAAGLGAKFDAMVLGLACADVVASGQDLVVHVNVGAARLGNAAFEQTLIHTLQRHGIAPSRLVVEITETVPIVDLAEGAAAIRRLKSLGIRVALDDFGAGYNSLTYLHGLPVDLIKLDRTMTFGIEPNHDAALYRSVIGLCDGLHLEVIAEGIETAGQANTILAAGCHLAQGYRFGRPMPLADLTAHHGATRA